MAGSLTLHMPISQQSVQCSGGRNRAGDRPSSLAGRAGCADIGRPLGHRRGAQPRRTAAVASRLRAPSRDIRRTCVLCSSCVYLRRITAPGSAPPACAGAQPKPFPRAVHTIASRAYGVSCTAMPQYSLHRSHRPAQRASHNAQATWHQTTGGRDRPGESKQRKEPHGQAGQPRYDAVSRLPGPVTGARNPHNHRHRRRRTRHQAAFPGARPAAALPRYEKRTGRLAASRLVAADATARQDHGKPTRARPVLPLSHAICACIHIYLYGVYDAP